MTPVKKILLVEDDNDDQELFSDALLHVSPETSLEVAENGKVALQALQINGWKPDLIFLDLNMPQMDGKQFLVHIKQIDELSSIPVIMFSTSSSVSDRQESEKLGASHFIIKPDKFDNLCRVLKNVLEGNYNGHT